MKEREDNLGPPIIAGIVWVTFVMVMYAWALLGTIYIIAGVVAPFFGFDPFKLNLDTQSITMGSMLGVVGASFVWMRRKEYIKFLDE